MDKRLLLIGALAGEVLGEFAYPGGIARVLLGPLQAALHHRGHVWGNLRRGRTVV